MGYPTLSNPLRLQVQSAEEVSLALKRILESPEWAQTARLAEFLRYVVEQSQQGAADQLKQTVIGVEVFGREPDYDPKADPVVRVEARRLRAKLQEYYAGSGAHDRIRIDLPKGSYQPQFVRIEPTVVPVAQPRRPWVSTAAAGAAIFIGILAGLFFLYRDSPRRIATPRLLTDRQAYNRSPRFSPDGTRVVFSRESGSGNSQIYVAPVSGGEAVPLTSGKVRDYEPEWSPDGRRIAFLRQTGPLEYSIVLREVGGTSEEMVLTGVRQRGSLAFSHDGRKLFFGDTAIYSLTLASRERARMTSPPAGISGDAQPQISPNGLTLAFLRKADEGVQDIFTQRLGGTEPRQISKEQRSFQGICWAADGHSILAGLARRDEMASIWRFPAEGGEPARVVEAGIGAITPAASPADGKLAFVTRIADTNNWRAALSSAGRTTGEPRQLTSSSALDTSPQISPDGSQIVWRSSSSGTNEIWIASSADGSNARVLTSMRGPLTGSPRWSSDGRHIVFESRRDGHGQLFLIPAAGGAPRQLTQNPWNSILPSWSRDGRSVYFASDRSGQWQIWRMTSDGQDAQQITRTGGFAGFESWDGKTVFYSRQSGGIWKVARDGGAETLVTAELVPAFWGQFSLSERGLFYAVFSVPPARAIRRLDLASGQIKDAVPLARMPVQWDSGMAVSRDESFITWSQLDFGASDIYVLEGFR